MSTARSMKDLLPDYAPPRIVSTLPRPKPADAFDGRTYAPGEDHKRLKGQLERVYDLMIDGRWRTLASIVEVCGGSEASVSARLRDLRKEKYGKLTIDRQRMNDSGLYQYRLLISK